MLLHRLLLQELHLAGILHEVAQVFFLATGDSFVEDISVTGSRHGSLSVSHLQQTLEETVKASLATLRDCTTKLPMAETS